MKDRDGIVLTSKKSMLREWKEYIEEPINENYSEI